MKGERSKGASERGAPGVNGERVPLVPTGGPVLSGSEGRDLGTRLHSLLTQHQLVVPAQVPFAEPGPARRGCRHVRDHDVRCVSALACGTGVSGFHREPVEPVRAVFPASFGTVCAACGVRRGADPRCRPDPRGNIGRLRRAGFNDRAILDACNVIACFNHADRMTMGLGLRPGSDPRGMRPGLDR